MQTQQSNKVIAEFMGGIPVFNNDGTIWEDAIHLDGHVWLIDKPTDLSFMIYLNYKKDWNMLIRVLEKIELLDYTVLIMEKHCQIIKKFYSGEAVTYQDADTKLEATYAAVIAFLHYYNTLNNENGK